MGTGNQNVQVIEKNDDGMIITLLSIAAEIHPILADVGLGMQHGIILLAEDRERSDAILKIFRETGSVICKSLKKMPDKLQNNILGIHPYTLYDKAEKIDMFLESDNFMPAVMVYGVMPDFLRMGNGNVIPFERGSDFSIYDMLHTLMGFRTYLCKNPGIIQREVLLFKTSERYLQSQDLSPLAIALEAAIRVLCCYYRESHKELETEQRRASLRRLAAYFMSLSETYTEECDVLDAVKRVMGIYVSNQPQIFLGRMDEIEGALAEALQDERAILYDADWYYIPERILRCACEPILGAVSFLNIKQELYEQGVLCCNNVAAKNFTIKKLLTNAYGYAFRARFLKLKKAFFTANDSFGLEERRGGQCLLESLTENLA